MKRMLSLFFGLLLLSIPVEAGAATLKGDVDGNGTVGISDVSALIDYLLSDDASEVNLENAEVSGDGLININDVSALIDYLLSGSWPSSEPQPTETFTVNGVSFTMVLVEGGTFMMGGTEEQGDDAEDDEYPVHQVTLSTYSIGQTEVTQELWEAVMSTAIDSTSMDIEGFLYPSYYSWKNGFVDIPQRPVEHITMLRLKSFIRQLSILTGREFRLPTEAEWEFAARGGNLSKGYKYAGSNNIDEVAWYWDNAWTVGEGSPDYGTHAVGTKAPNELGLYDMSGNVFERTADRAYYTYPSEPEVDPSYPIINPGQGYSTRGGDFRIRPKYCRVSARVGYGTMAFEDVGFRLAL